MRALAARKSIFGDVEWRKIDSAKEVRRRGYHGGKSFSEEAYDRRKTG